MSHMMKVLFMRHDRRRKRGDIVWRPYAMSMQCSLEHFILVKIDMSKVPAELIEKQALLKLKLDKLMKQYPPTPRKVVHEGGTTETVMDAGYFDEEGVSSHSDPVEITVGDITWEGK
ncbi:MAG: hypothetical protein GY774_00320 [Planctomycetes bacterium]|nr:hypothetical protein [Planctomycetota bacterium]